MEKLLRLKKKLTKALFIAGGGVLLSFALYVYLNFTLEDTSRYASQIEKETLSLQKKSGDTRNQNESIARSVRIYNDLPAPKKSTPELEDTASRIRTARPLIDEFRIRYKFSSINVNFSKVEDVTAEFKIKNASVHKNVITIDFKALTDELVFAFVDTMIQRMPGYITISSIEIDRVSDITPAVIKALLTRQPNIPFLVSGKITLHWWSVSEAKAKPADTKKENN